MSSSQSNAERLLANRSPGLTGGPLRTVEVSQDYVFGASAGRGTSSNTTGGAVRATSTTGVAGNPVTAGYGDTSASRTPSAVRAGQRAAFGLFSERMASARESEVGQKG